jgi:type IV pilus assembly protein PilC
MPVYVWKGTDRQGKRQSGEIEADNPSLARQFVIRKGITISSFKAKPKDLLEYLPFLKTRVTEKELVVFVRQFATLINAGLPLVQSLEILRDQQDNKTFSGVLKDVKRDVEGGATFSDAIKKHPRVFDYLFLHMVAAGEAGGILDVILNRLATYIEKIAKLKKKVKGAMTYPAIVVTIAVSVIAVILIYVIPVFTGLFKDAGVKLPALTLFVINLSDFTKRFFFWMILGVILLVFFLRKIRKQPRGRLATDRLLLRAPVFGLLIRKVAIARFSRTLGTLLSSGVPILDAMNIVANTAGNAVLENAIREARTAIAEGRSVADPLQETKVFPPMVTKMIAVGEATGALDSMLEKIADFYDEEVDTTVEALTSLLEPLLIVFLGVTIGGILVAMYMPIFQLADVVSRGS